MKSRTTFFFILMVMTLIALTACASPGAGAPETTEPPIVVTEEPTSEPESTTPFTLEWLATLAPRTILLQQDYEPTYFRMEAMYEFGREPVFILYADGTLIYSDEGETYDQLRITSVKLSPEETLALVQQVMDAGFQNLESHTDFCSNADENGEQMCVADAAITVLRVIQPDSTLREVRIYADFANDKIAFETITGLFYGYTHPEAQMYVPEKATLFLNQLASSSDLVVQPWPLNPEILAGYVFSVEILNPIILSGQELTDFLNATRNFGDFYFELDGKYYSAYLVPWAPDKDYTAVIESEFSQP